MYGGQSEPETTVTVEIQGQKESTIAKGNGGVVSMDFEIKSIRR